MTKREAGRLGGIARAKQCTPAQLSRIGHLGLIGLAERRFNGDVDKAKQWLIKRGLMALDAHYPQYMQVWRV